MYLLIVYTNKKITFHLVSTNKAETETQKKIQEADIKEKFSYTESVSSLPTLSSFCKVAGEFAAEFSAVTAPVPSPSWLLKRDENENGLEVELAF